VRDLIIVSICNCRLNLLDVILLRNLQVSHELVESSSTGCTRHLHILSQLHHLLSVLLMRGLKPHIRFTYKEGERFPIYYNYYIDLLVSLFKGDCLVNIFELHLEYFR
jgi:hypothetical protein